MLPLTVVVGSTAMVLTRPSVHRTLARRKYGKRQTSETHSQPEQRARIEKSGFANATSRRFTIGAAAKSQWSKISVFHCIRFGLRTCILQASKRLSPCGDRPTPNNALFQESLKPGTLPLVIGSTCISQAF